MPWKKMLAHVSGSIEAAVLKQNEYLREENRTLLGQVEGRLRLTDAERRSLAEKAVALGKDMTDTVTIV